MLTRISAIADVAGSTDHTYAEGLLTTLSAAVEYGIEVLEQRGESTPDIPVALLAQARLAARNGVSLDIVLRRYFAGHALFGDFLIQESEHRLSTRTLNRLLKAQAVAFDSLIVAVSDEYRRETESRSSGTGQRRTERIKRLLDGELLDTSELAYDFEATHLGVLAIGQGSEAAIRDFATTHDFRLLFVYGSADVIWAWFGARRRIDPTVLEGAFGGKSGIRFAVGEAARGLGGWRLTHEQAKAALPVALRSQSNFARYADVALLASILQDNLLATLLRQRYLDPLKEERDDGETARRTLRAYFAARRNITSAAAALGVDRRTVSRRLRAIEARIERSLDLCGVDVELALRLDDLGRSVNS